MARSVAEIVAAFPELQSLNPVPETRDHISTALCCGVLGARDIARAVAMQWPGGGELCDNEAEVVALLYKLGETPRSENPSKSPSDLYSEITWTPTLRRLAAEWNFKSRYELN